MRLCRVNHSVYASRKARMMELDSRTPAGSRMKVGAVIQARMSSQRLPGKVLRSLLGQPVLAYVIEIVRRGGADQPVVATSDDASDDPVEEYCRLHDVPCERGSLHDVASRFASVLDNSDWGALVRVSADSPLLDYRLVRWAVEAIRRDGCDVATNVHPRTYPRGQSVEAVRREVFETGLDWMDREGDREHVMPAFYRNARRFGLVNLTSPTSFGDEHLAIDSPEDFLQVEATLARLEQAPWNFTLEQIVAAFTLTANEAANEAPAREAA